MRKRLILSGWLTSKFMAQELIIVVQACAFVLACAVLLTTFGYVQHSFTNINLCLPNGTMFFLPAYRLDSMVASEYLSSGASALDADVTAYLDEHYSGAAYGRGLYGSATFPDRSQPQLLGYDNIMCANTSLVVEQGEWLSRAPVKNGMIPLVIRGVLKEKYPLGSTMEFSFSSPEYPMEPVSVRGYVAGVIAADEIVFHLRSGATQPDASSITGRDVVYSWTGDADYYNTSMILLNYDQLNTRNLPVSACRYIFPSSTEMDAKAVSSSFGNVWEVSEIVGNSIEDYLLGNSERIARAMALLLCSLTALTGYSILWYKRNGQSIAAYEASGMSRNRIRGICCTHILSLNILGTLPAFALMPTMVKYVFLEAELNAGVYSLTVLSALIVALIGVGVSWLYSSNWPVVVSGRGD